MNAENVADGRGLTPKLADRLLASGADVLTLGNHAWARDEIRPYLAESKRVIRPANLAAGLPGRGLAVAEAADGTQVAVVNLLGSLFLNPPVGPFEVQYRFEMANRADVALTLKRITITTVNPEGGAYSLTAPHDYYFNKEIASKSSDAVDFWVKAYGYGRSMRDTEPVTIRGVAYFQAAGGGYLNQVFIRELPQIQ